jgi:hypothetical protein
MAGLPHFNSAKAAVSLYEPVFLNQFEVIVQPPAAVFNPLGNGGRSLMVENILSITGLEVDKNPSALITQNYKFAKRRYAGGMVDDTGVSLRIEFETNLDDNNSNYVHKTLRQWSDLVYNPLTGAMGIKSTYAGGTYILVSIFNKQGDVFRRMKFLNCFPKAQLTAMPLNYESASQSYKITAEFRADFFEDVFN